MYREVRAQDEDHEGPEREKDIIQAYAKLGKERSTRAE